MSKDVDSSASLSYVKPGAGSVINDKADVTTDIPLFMAGDSVVIRRAYPIGHCRTPAYFRGATGVVERSCGAFANPEELAYGRSGEPAIHLYRVRARQSELWVNYTGSDLDTIEVEVFEHWLLPATEIEAQVATHKVAANKNGHSAS